MAAESSDKPESPADAFADPADGPRTAPDLAKMPLPEVSEVGKAQGYTVDPVAVAAIYADAEAEDLVPLVYHVLTTVTQLAEHPVPPLEDAMRELEGLWGTGRKFAA